MSTATRLGLAVALTVVAACIPPADQRPGLWLRGELVETAPPDWSFTDAYREIAIEIHTPYLVAHSVTIWCASLDGRLYLGARSPDTKRWPGWVDRDPDVRLGIGEQIYEVRLAALDDPERVARLQRAYAAKYDLPDRTDTPGPAIRYWLVEPRI